MKPINHGILLRIYELNDLKNTIEENVEIEVDQKTMKTFFRKRHQIVFNSELSEVLGFTKKKYTAGTNLREKSTKTTVIDKTLFICDSVDGSVVNGRRESVFFPFSLNAPPVFNIFKEPISILFRTVNKKNILRIVYS